MEDDGDALVQVKCLFCDEWFTDGAPTVLEHCEAVHGFRFRDVKHKFGRNHQYDIFCYNHHVTFFIFYFIAIIIIR